MYITEPGNGSQYKYKLIFNDDKAGLQIRKGTMERIWDVVKLAINEKPILRLAIPQNK